MNKTTIISPEKKEISSKSCYSGKKILSLKKIVLFEGNILFSTYFSKNSILNMKKSYFLLE